jgi:sarcosine oxidase subunit delta
MLIDCPYCGARDAQEFSYRGEAASPRPDPAASDAADQFHDHVYLRDNPAGLLRETWHHGAGCRRWIAVWRNTLTHEIVATHFASDAEARS